DTNSLSLEWMADPETPTVKQITSNLEALIFRRGFADLRPMPSTLIYRGPQRRVYRYRPVTSSAATRTTGRKGAGNRPAVRRGPGSLLPVLLVPPLAAPALCFDLRRNCSLVEFLVNAGHPTYIVDYGAIACSDC